MLGIYCRTSREQDIETSTISQQRTAGIKFAVDNKFEYEIYEDAGKSGYKISDNEQDPFKDRPSFANLINDIKSKKIDKVWVWEISRLSRNEYATAYIFNVFVTNHIELWVLNKRFDINDPQLKVTRQILSAVAEYERTLIVNRTTRGLRKHIDEGKRSHQKLYCYRKEGKDDKGYTKWVPVESEIENYKHILKRYVEGTSLRKISLEVYDQKRSEKWSLPSYAHFLGRILRGYQYTGYQLTIEGNDIFKRFRKNEVKSIEILKDRKYWIKSVPYPIELITIEDWIEVCERLQVLGNKMYSTRKEVILRARKDIATGLIECGDCGNKFYHHEQKLTDKKTGKSRFYVTYFHHAWFNNKVCKQRPKSYYIEYINEIFKLFFFYSYLVFDNTNDLIEESQRNIKHQQIKTKEKIVKIEKEILTIEKRKARFQNKLDNSDMADDLLELLLRNIKSSEEKQNELNIELSKLKIDYEMLNEKFNQTLLEMTYYDVKEKINDWFYNMNVEEQRNELIRIIKTCKIFNHYIIIDTGKIVFLFDIDQHYIFDMKLLENLNRDEVYKEHFVELKGKRKARTYNDKLIHNVNLTRDKETRMRVFQYLMKEYHITYDISEKTNLISFIPLRGLMMLEVEQFGIEE